MGSFVGGGNQYIKVLYCELLTIGKQLPTFPHKVQGLNHRTQTWDLSDITPYFCVFGKIKIHKSYKAIFPGFSFKFNVLQTTVILNIPQVG